MKGRDSLLYYLGQLNTGENRRIVILPAEEGKLIASLQKLHNGEWKELNRANLEFAVISEEDALPIVSRVEWDETTGQIQAPIPVKYLLKSQRPRMSSHIHRRSRPRRGNPGRAEEIAKLIEEIQTGERSPLFNFQNSWVEATKKKE